MEMKIKMKRFVEIKIKNKKKNGQNNWNSSNWKVFFYKLTIWIFVFLIFFLGYLNITCKLTGYSFIDQMNLCVHINRLKHSTFVGVCV